MMIMKIFRAIYSKDNKHHYNWTRIFLILNFELVELTRHNLTYICAFLPSFAYDFIQSCAIDLGLLLNPKYRLADSVEFENFL